MSSIYVKHINKTYGDKKVLEDFSASFECGRCTAIMGPSGCGKTTLLRILMGIDKDFEGDVVGMPERFGAVFQEDRLCEEFTVMANIRMVIEGAHGKDAANEGKNGSDGSKTAVNEAISGILAELGLSEYAGSKVSELSGGQKRRVAIARALAYGAELLIMDEPFKGLDEETRNAAAGAVRRRQKTVIMVTHDSEEVRIMGAQTVNM